jgi:uncharacterized membrane protein YjjP (DUF1212 family)
MESLAALVAAMFVGFIALSLVNLLLVVLARRGKIRLWIGIVSNTITGLIAIWGISAAWALGIAPMISVIIGSIVLTLPKRRQ